MRTVFAMCALLSTACQSGGPRANTLAIQDVTKDTTIRLTKAQGNLSPGISLRAVGTLDDSATVTLRNPRQPEKIYWQTWLLPSGRLDSLKQRFDYYDHDVDLIYSHGRVSRGQLRITITY
jgi:hypothetical protein